MCSLSETVYCKFHEILPFKFYTSEFHHCKIQTSCIFLLQFNSFICVIKDMLNRLEAEHKTKLEQLHVMQEQQK